MTALDHDPHHLDRIEGQRKAALVEYLAHVNRCPRCVVTAIGATGGHLIRLCTTARNLRAIYNARRRDCVRAAHR